MTGKRWEAPQLKAEPNAQPGNQDRLDRIATDRSAIQQCVSQLPCVAYSKTRTYLADSPDRSGFSRILTLVIDSLSFEAFFNAIYHDLGTQGFGAAGREVVNADFFRSSGPLAILPLRSLQFGVAYLVKAQELPEKYNDAASVIVTVEDAYALLAHIDKDASRRILPVLAVAT